jgi:hypothetical protein
MAEGATRTGGTGRTVWLMMEALEKATTDELCRWCALNPYTSIYSALAVPTKAVVYAGVVVLACEALTITFVGRVCKYITHLPTDFMPAHIDVENALIFPPFVWIYRIDCSFCR